MCLEKWIWFQHLENLGGASQSKFGGGQSRGEAQLKKHPVSSLSSLSSLSGILPRQATSRQQSPLWSTLARVACHQQVQVGFQSFRLLLVLADLLLYWAIIGLCITFPPFPAITALRVCSLNELSATSESTGSYQISLRSDHSSISRWHWKKTWFCPKIVCSFGDITSPLIHLIFKIWWY